MMHHGMLHSKGLLINHMGLPEQTREMALLLAMKSI